MSLILFSLCSLLLKSQDHLDNKIHKIVAKLTIMYIMLNHTLISGLHDIFSMTHLGHQYICQTSVHTNRLGVVSLGGVGE